MYLAYNDIPMVARIADVHFIPYITMYTNTIAFLDFSHYTVSEDTSFTSIAFFKEIHRGATTP